ncbi:MAG: CoA transferase [Steroidobacteraceae bacterium]|jgi:crotonobetainyl-CoA:carnitine CoA-transferase CaiB-like acyl-CoA transferase|nr:CoA transferase [Steroidobacteraceae bacterium]
MSLPLAGYRVLTFENFGAGPFGSLYLADLGAEVIKVENREQGGDATRGMGPFLGEHDSHFFQAFNYNKKSVCLNLKTEAGRQAFRRLAASAHVVMNNLRGDQPEKLGLTYAALSDVNPRLVCAHLSAYGRDNERKAWPGYDYLMQAEAGYLHVTGEPGSAPARMGLSIVDYMTGITTALAILAALLGVARDGRGRDVDVSLFDVALHQLTYPGAWYLNAGQKTERLARSSHPSATPVQLFPTKDGWIFIMCMTEKFWRALIAELGRPELGADPRFATVEARRQHRPELTEVLDAVFREDTTGRWLARLRHQLPAAPVNDLPQALDNPYAHAIGMVRPLPHPRMPGFRALANPIKLDGARLPLATAPALGANTEEVLAGLGYDAADIARLRAAGAL